MALVQNYFAEDLGLGLSRANLCALGDGAFLRESYAVTARMLEGVGDGEGFEVEGLMQVLSFLYCLARGVKNRESLDCLKRFFVEDVRTSRKAEAAKRLVAIVVQQLE